MRYVMLCMMLVAGIFAACTEFSSGDQAGTQPTADGGLDGSRVTGTPTGVLAFTLSPDTSMLTHGTTARIKVTIARSGGFVGTVRFTLHGAPEGISANFLELEPGITEGYLEVVIDPAMVQGPVNGMAIEASNASVGLSVIQDFPAFVRGKPGEIDTTYGDAGYYRYGGITLGTVVFDTDKNNGELIIAKDTVSNAPSTRLGADGRTTAPFAPDLLPGNVRMVSNGYVYTETTTVDTTASTAHLNFVRYDSQTGERDPQYFRDISHAVAGVQSFGLGNLNELTDGTFVAQYTYFTTVTGYGIVWLRPDGTSYFRDTDQSYVSNGSYRAESAFSLQNYIYTIGKTGLRRYDSTSFDEDPNFTNTSAADFISKPPTMTIDTSGNTLIATMSDLRRFRTNGSSDRGFLNPTTTIASANPAIRIQRDGKILKAVQASNDPGHGICAIFRYADSGQPDLDFGINGLAAFQSQPCAPISLHELLDGRVFVVANLSAITASPIAFKIWE